MEEITKVTVMLESGNTKVIHEFRTAAVGLKLQPMENLLDIINTPDRLIKSHEEIRYTFEMETSELLRDENGMYVRTTKTLVDKDL